MGYYVTSRTQKRAVPYVQMEFLVFVWHFKDSTTLSRPPVGLQLCFLTFMRHNNCWLYTVVENYIYLFLTHSSSLSFLFHSFILELNSVNCSGCNTALTVSCLHLTVKAWVHCHSNQYGIWGGRSEQTIHRTLQLFSVCIILHDLQCTYEDILLYTEWSSGWPYHLAVLWPCIQYILGFYRGDDIVHPGETLQKFSGSLLLICGIWKFCSKSSESPLH